MYQFYRVNSHTEKHLNHLIIYTEEPSKTLPSDFENIWKGLSRKVFLKETVHKSSFLFMLMKKPFFMKIIILVNFTLILKKVVELIKNSYRDIIYFNDDPKTGWGYVSLNNSPYSWEFTWSDFLVNLEKDLPLVDYLNKPKNNNIWIVTIVLITKYATC